MSWQKLNKTISAHSLMALDAQSCRDYGIKLDRSFPFQRVKFRCQALAMLSQLNDFDQRMVEKEIIKLSLQPNSKSSTKHSRNPFKRLWRTQYPFRNYHYLITFRVQESEIQIDDILFDDDLQGRKTPFSHERTMLYKVDRLNSTTYNKPMTKEELETLPDAWNTLTPTPVTQIGTLHAAVNGMDNRLQKGAWLMGTHLDTAYQSDTIQAYTLLHNPTDKGFLDLCECAFDKRLGRKSHNAQHLAAILAQNAQQNKKVKWVAHSQGAIIFCAALDVYMRTYNIPLLTQQLAIHGSGAYAEQLKERAFMAGLTVNSVRNNPFDLVPNLAGGNDISTSSLVRSLQFRPLVKKGGPGASPHTLPFLGLKSYAQQLDLLGYKKEAAIVNKFIQTLPEATTNYE